MWPLQSSVVCFMHICKCRKISYFRFNGIHWQNKKIIGLKFMRSCNTVWINWLVMRSGNQCLKFANVLFLVSSTWFLTSSIHLHLSFEYSTSWVEARNQTERKSNTLSVQLCLLRSFLIEFAAISIEGKCDTLAISLKWRCHR